MGANVHVQPGNSVQMKIGIQMTRTLTRPLSAVSTRTPLTRTLSQLFMSLVQLLASILSGPESTHPPDLQERMRSAWSAGGNSPQVSPCGRCRVCIGTIGNALTSGSKEVRNAPFAREILLRCLCHPPFQTLVRASQTGAGLVASGR